MTSKLIFEGVLMELNKQNAPSIDLETFNYFFNKAINLYINKLYNFGVDTDQQRTDDIRVLKTSTFLTPVATPFTSVRNTLPEGYGRTQYSNYPTYELNTIAGKLAGDVISQYSIYGATYEFNLPADYLHLLNCICVYKVNKRINCPYNIGDIVRKGAIKCNADTWAMIIDNLYMRPTYKRPYYYIINVNQLNVNPTNPMLLTSQLIRPDGSVMSGNKIDTKTSIPYVGTDSYTTEGVETTKNLEDSTLYASSTKNSSESTLKAVNTSSDLPLVQQLMETIPREESSSYTSKSDAALLGNTEGVSTSAYNVSKYANPDNPGSQNTVVSDPQVGTNSSYAQEMRVNNKYILNINGTLSEDSTVVRTAGHRYGNTSNVRLEIRYGQDNSVFELIGVLIDYIKTPQFIRLTLELLDFTEDTSLIMEFPDYICQLILDELVKIIMENASDPRLQTHPVVSLSIAAPAQLLQNSKK